MERLGSEVDETLTQFEFAVVVFSSVKIARYLRVCRFPAKISLFFVINRNASQPKQKTVQM